MNRILRDEEAVSPVIATILMVAITVVLAATLYMMVGDFGDNGDMPLTASITVEGGELDNSYVNGLEVRVDSMSEPSSAEPGDVEIRIVYEDTDGTPREYIFDLDEPNDESYVSSYTGRDGDDIVTGTTIYFNDIDLNDDVDSLDRVELRVDGYDGSTSSSF